jgi:hypothetical protein
MKRTAPVITAVLAIAAGAIHLAHNYLPMQTPAPGIGGPPPAATGTGPGGLMSIVMPHLTQVMVLNFVGFAGLAVLLLVVARTQPILRVIVDLLLSGMSIATLYAWNVMGRSNPYGTGMAALVVELGLIVIALGDAAFTAIRSRVAASAAAPSSVPA